ncbi:MAG: hypothetical protein PUC06_06870 [Oscillospiraceae bacterium]|nr:hypothetical protein [Oscillospiraceae bacterium]
MKRLFHISGVMLVLLLLFLPAGMLISSYFGYEFALASMSAYTIILASLSAGLAVFSIRTKTVTESGIVKVLFALLTPLSLVNAVFCLLVSSSVWTVVCVLICFVFCLFLTIKHGNPLALKTTTLALSALLALPIGCFCFILLFFGSIGQTTVVNSVESPGGTYCAEVIDSDQGALGGDTLVEVYEKSTFNGYFFTISRKPQIIYQGEWGESRSMEIHWKNNRCLVINSAEYEME